jgi:uncharacterized membrane protein
MNKPLTVGFMDRIVSCLSYVSVGWVGFIVLILLYFMKRKSSRFLRYNVFQSIFIALLFYVVAQGFDYILKLLSYIPFVNYIISTITTNFSVGIFQGYSLFQIFLFGLIVYLAFCSFVGRYPRVYWISNIIDRQE